MNIERLKELRKQKGLTQTQLGAIFGFSNQRYNYYETGKREPDHETINMFADFFNVSADYLLGRVDDPQGIGVGVYLDTQKSVSVEDIEDWTQEELEEIENFKEYVKSKRTSKNKGVN